MISAINLAQKASRLKKGESFHVAWQREFPDVRSIYAILSKELIDLTFEVHETINGYTIKSI